MVCPVFSRASSEGSEGSIFGSFFVPQIATAMGFLLQMTMSWLRALSREGAGAGRCELTMLVVETRCWCWVPLLGVETGRVLVRAAGCWVPGAGAGCRDLLVLAPADCNSLWEPVPSNSKRFQALNKKRQHRHQIVKTRLEDIITLAPTLQIVHCHKHRAAAPCSGLQRHPHTGSKAQTAANIARCAWPVCAVEPGCWLPDVHDNARCLLVLLKSAAHGPGATAGRVHFGAFGCSCRCRVAATCVCWHAATPTRRFNTEGYPG